MGRGGEAQSQLVCRASDGKTREMGWHVWRCKEAQQGRHDEIHHALSSVKQGLGTCTADPSCSFCTVRLQGEVS